MKGRSYFPVNKFPLVYESSQRWARNQGSGDYIDGGDWYQYQAVCGESSDDGHKAGLRNVCL
jgi:hypothetical protein